MKNLTILAVAVAAIITFAAIYVGINYKQLTDRSATYRCELKLPHSYLSKTKEERGQLLDDAWVIINKRISSTNTATVINAKIDSDYAGIIATIRMTGGADPSTLRALTYKPGRIGFYNTYEASDLASLFTSFDENVIKTNAEKYKIVDLETPMPAALHDILNYNVNYGATAFRQGPVIGYAKVTDTAQVMAVLGSKEMKGTFPKDLQMMWGIKPTDTLSKLFTLNLIKNGIGNDAPITDDIIKKASMGFDQSGTPEVEIEMTINGASRWTHMTDEAANATPGLRKCIAIVIDGQVYSAPQVRSKITGGRSVINYIDSKLEAQNLASMLNSGQLHTPVRLKSFQLITNP